ncbi:DUF975 family protein [Streptococcus suis]|nr:DUF975 family protein [Streptococcus suis]HEM5469600.1 DUF975 family protein [Streptococcus suis]
MRTNDIVSRAMMTRERTRGTTLLFLPSILLSIIYAIPVTIFRLLTFLELRQNSAFVEGRLVSSIRLTYLGKFSFALLLQLFIGLSCFHLLELLRGDRQEFSLKDSFSFLKTEWKKPICATFLYYYLLLFIAGLPANLGAALFIKGFTMSSLMVLSPGAMAELAVHQPSQLMKIGATIFLLGMISYLFVYYTYSQVVFVLYDHLDNASYTGPLAVFRESRFLMKGNYWQRIWLDLSFLGWFIGELLTLHLLSFFVTPYYHLSRTIFYEKLKKQRLSAVE